MEATTGEWSGPADPRRGAVRHYTFALGQRIALAVYAATHLHPEADDLFAGALRLADAGLSLLEQCCADRIRAGWAASLIGTITAFRSADGGHHPGILAAWGVEYFNAAFVALEAALPPEDRMPPGLVYVAGVGLQLRPRGGDTRSPGSSSGRCPVRVLDVRPGGKIVIEVGGVEREIQGRHRQAFRRAVVKMVAAWERDAAGITGDELGDDQGSVSFYRNHGDPVWREVIGTPGARGRRGESKYYRILDTHLTQAAS